MSDRRASPTAPAPTSLPVLRSPLTTIHANFGAEVLLEGGAEAVRSYGDPERERAAMSESIGLADITVRAKIDIRGDVDRVLASSSIEGLARMTPDWAMMFAPPGPVNDRVASMQASAGDSTMVTDATHLYGGFALAGPRLPDALARLTSWDPSTLDAGAATGAPIADIRAILMRREDPMPLMEVWVSMEFLRYAWLSILDVVDRLGGEPVGWDVLRERGWR